MPLTPVQTLASIAVMSVVTFLTRALPFLLFDRGDHPPKIVLYLGHVLPPAVIAMLIVYCLKGVTFTTIGGWLPPLIAGLAAVLLQGNDRAGEVDRIAVVVHDHLDQIGVEKSLETFCLVELPRKRGDCYAGVVKTGFERCDLLGRDKRFVALNVDYNVGVRAYIRICLATTVCAAAVTLRGHYGFATECCDRVEYAAVVCRHDDIVEFAGCLTVDAFDHSALAYHG